MEKELCCKHLKFMWDNHLLEERDTSEYYRLDDGIEILVSFIKGYRVRRSFFFFRRDQVLYNCPYCNAELIFTSGVRIPQMKFNFRVEITAIGKTFEKPKLHIPMSALKEALFTTKMRCKEWPPKE